MRTTLSLAHTLKNYGFELNMLAIGLVANRILIGELKGEADVFGSFDVYKFKSLDEIMESISQDDGTRAHRIYFLVGDNKYQVPKLMMLHDKLAQVFNDNYVTV